MWENSRRKYPTWFIVFFKADVSTIQKEGASSESVDELINWKYLEWKEIEIDVKVIFNLLFVVHGIAMMFFGLRILLIKIVLITSPKLLRIFDGPNRLECEKSAEYRTWKITLIVMILELIFMDW